MTKNNKKLGNDTLKIVCDKVNDNLYISKKGEEYIKALAQLNELKNRNDKPFLEKDIMQEPLLQDFKFPGVKDYIFICNLKAEPMELDFSKAHNKTHGRKNERIIAFNFKNTQSQQLYEKAKGISYIITTIINKNEYIIKIGQSRNTFKDRLQSYNCGCIYNWRTASTTNIKLLQSMVATRLIFNLYLCDCSQDQYVLTWHNVTSVRFASPKSLAVEDIMVKQFYKEFHKKPLANIQTNATDND